MVRRALLLALLALAGAALLASQVHADAELFDEGDEASMALMEGSDVLLTMDEAEEASSGRRLLNKDQHKSKSSGWGKYFGKSYTKKSGKKSYKKYVPKPKKVYHNDKPKYDNKYYECHYDSDCYKSHKYSHYAAGCVSLKCQHNKCKVYFKDGYQCEDGNKYTCKDKCYRGYCKPGYKCPVSECYKDEECVAKYPTDKYDHGCYKPAYCDKVNYKCIPPVVKKDEPCEDGNKCTYPDKCDYNGKCAPGPNKCECYKDEECVAKYPTDKYDHGCYKPAYCDKDHKCIPPVVKKDEPCEDGNKCTYPDKCDYNGKCAPGPNKCECYKDEECVAKYPTDKYDHGCYKPAYCDKDHKCIPPVVKKDEPCEDGNKCTYPDKCDYNGKCAPGPNKCECYKDEECVAKYPTDKYDDGCYKPAYCDKVNYKCIPPVVKKDEPCEDGNKCTYPDKCDYNGKCAPGPNKCECYKDEECVAKYPTDKYDDGCYKPAYCDKVNYKCIPPVVKKDEPCEDGNECTYPDKCDYNGKCAPGPNKCECYKDEECVAKYPTDKYDDGCYKPAYCDKVNYKCIPPVVKKDEPCEDGNECTYPDKCDYNGKCAPGPNKCECYKDEECVAKYPTDKYDDGCYKPAYCDKDHKCIPPVVKKDEPCEDGNECTYPDKCDYNGKCAPGPNKCECYKDEECVAKYPTDKYDDGCYKPAYCDKVNYKCIPPVVKKDEPCEDGNECTYPDKCDHNGKCAPGPNKCEDRCYHYCECTDEHTCKGLAHCTWSYGKCSKKIVHRDGGDDDEGDDDDGDDDGDD